MSITIAKTTTIKDMVAGQVADETREWFRIVSDDDVLRAVTAYEEYEAFMADPTLDEVQFARHAAVADPDNISVPEKVFVELRFFAANDQDSTTEPVNVAWVQVNSTNIPNLSAGFFGDLLKVFNALRALTPFEPAA